MLIIWFNGNTRNFVLRTYTYIYICIYNIQSALTFTRYMYVTSYTLYILLWIYLMVDRVSNYTWIQYDRLHTCLGGNMLFNISPLVYWHAVYVLFWETFKLWIHIYDNNSKKPYTYTHSCSFLQLCVKQLDHTHWYSHKSSPNFVYKQTHVYYYTYLQIYSSYLG